MRLEVTPYHFSAPASADVNQSGDITTATTSNTAGRGANLDTKTSRNSATPTHQSSLHIKVPDGNKKTTPPKPAPKRSMRRRRLGDEYYYPNEDEVVDGSDRGTATSTVGGDDSGTSSSTTGAGIKHGRHSQRVKRESTESGGSSKKNTGRSKTSSSAKTLPNSLRTEDIPIGQWLVLISLLFGIVGYVRYFGKNSTPEKHSSGSRKKKDKKKPLNKQHNNSRRKGKGQPSNSSKAVSRHHISKTNNTYEADQNGTEKQKSALNTKQHKPPVDKIIDTPKEKVLQSSSSRKKKQRVRKKAVKTINPVVEDSLSSKTSPDSVSTDGSSSANVSHQDRDLLITEDDSNQSFSSEYEDVGDFEVERSPEGWTTVVNRAPKIPSSDALEKLEEVVESISSKVHSNESVSKVKELVQVQDDLVISNTGKESVPVINEGDCVTKELLSRDEVVTISKTDKTVSAKIERETPVKIECEAPVKIECEPSVKIECEAPIKVEREAPFKIETEAVVEKVPLTAVISDSDKEVVIDKIESDGTISNEKEESQRELKELNVITSLNDQDMNGQQNDTVEKSLSSFSQEDDEALARMLQKEEEEMAAAADTEYEFKAVSPKGPVVNDVWEEVKTRRISKKPPTTTMEEQ